MAKLPLALGCGSNGQKVKSPEAAFVTSVICPVCVLKYLCSVYNPELAFEEHQLQMWKLIFTGLSICETVNRRSD